MAASSGGGSTPKSAYCRNYVSLQSSITVPEPLIAGEKFIKWDEDSNTATPVTLRVDESGFYLYWIDQNHEMDMIDIATIRDTRTGKYAKIPKDFKLRNLVTMGSQDTLEEKTVTVCCASDFVNINFINFCCTKKEIAQLWTDSLMYLAYNLTQLNGPTILFLRKAHAKLFLMIDKTGKIPIKNVLKMFAQNKDDRKRVEKALDISGLPSGKNDTIVTEKLGFEDFFNFYKNLTQRLEVEKVFDELVGTSKRRLMSATQLVEFLNKTQRDPRLNEILHPYANIQRAKEIIQLYEPNKYNANRGQFSSDGFLRFLMSEDNSIMAVNKLDLSDDDMDHPLSHYFVKSSHNTYLTGHQITGKSSVEIYRQCLLAGCRCVELDFWNGKTEEPVIVHGYTFVPEISAREVIEAIAESAFKTSDYPVVLSFENHCNPKQQAKIANYCREFFGDMLLDQPMDSHKIEPGTPLPPPSLLKRKIIIKNKKKHHHHHKKTASAIAQALPVAVQPETPSQITQTSQDQSNGAQSPTIGTTHAPPLQARQSSKDSTGTEEESSTDEEPDNVENSETAEVALAVGITSGAAVNHKAQAKETEAGAEISALVNYVQPVHFSSFENAERKNRHYEMSSFDEKQATTLLKERPIEFVNYNKNQLSRVYPSGTRFDSSNFMPQVFWNAGCQLVALNYQTLDLAMQLNLGIFEYNLRSGYLLKPEFMRKKDRRLDPFAESTVDGIIAGSVSITVISAQFLTDKRVGTYVEVDMYGLPADTVRKKFRTKIVPNNGINPVYGEEPFVFRKVVLPELAFIRISAYEESGKFIGHRILPVVGLCPGYRHVNLRNDIGQPLPLATLFLFVVVKDYVPDGLSDFAEALANPIKYQSELEKRSEQLAVFMTDDADVKCAEDDVTGDVGSNVDVADGEDNQVTSPVCCQRQSISNLGQSTDGNVDSDHEVNAQPAHNSSKTLQEQNSFSKLGGGPLGPLASVLLPSSDTEQEPIVAETLEQILDNKQVKEKRLELDKKLEQLRKKHEKEKARLQTTKSSDFGADRRSKFYMSHRLVKRLSSKNINLFSTTGDGEKFNNTPSTAMESSTTELPESEGVIKPGLPRSQSERLLAAFREHIVQERDMRDKYHDIIYGTAEKVLHAAQTRQMKNLESQFNRETASVMRKLQAARRDEVKALAKIHRDRDELVRIKREVASSVVERGVSERVRLTQQYERRKDELQRQYDQLKDALIESKEKAKSALTNEFETRYARVESNI